MVQRCERNFKVPFDFYKNSPPPPTHTKKMNLSNGRKYAVKTSVHWLQWIEIIMGYRRDFYPIVHGTIYILGDCARPKLDEEQPQMMRFWKKIHVSCYSLKPGKYSGFKRLNYFSFLRNGRNKIRWQERSSPVGNSKENLKGFWFLIKICARLLTSSLKISRHRRCLWCLNGWCWVLVHFVVRVASNGQRPQKPFDADYVYFS